MSNKAQNWAWNIRGLREKKIGLLHVCDCHNTHTGICEISNKFIGLECEKDPKTISRWIDFFVAADLLILVKKGRGRGNFSKYKVNFKFVESTVGTQHIVYDEKRPTDIKDRKDPIKGDKLPPFSRNIKGDKFSIKGDKFLIKGDTQMSTLPIIPLSKHAQKCAPINFSDLKKEKGSSPNYRIDQLLDIECILVSVVQTIASKLDNPSKINSYLEGSYAFEENEIVTIFVQPIFERRIADMIGSSIDRKFWRIAALEQIS